MPGGGVSKARWKEGGEDTRFLVRRGSDGKLIEHNQEPAPL